MASTNRRSKTANVFTEDVLTQIATSLKQLLEVHGQDISDAVDDNTLHKLTINFGVSVDCSGSAPEIDVSMGYIPKKVTDARKIHCTDPNQREFEIMTPAQVEEAREAEKERLKAEAEAEAERKAAEVEAAEAEAASSTGTGEKPKSKRRKKGD